MVMGMDMVITMGMMIMLTVIITQLINTLEITTLQNTKIINKDKNINNKKINYSLDFEMAFDVINNVI
jgi:uncharacterized membrane protein